MVTLPLCALKLYVTMSHLLQLASMFAYFKSVGNIQRLKGLVLHSSNQGLRSLSSFPFIVPHVHSVVSSCPASFPRVLLFLHSLCPGSFFLPVWSWDELCHWGEDPFLFFMHLEVPKISSAPSCSSLAQWGSKRRAGTVSFYFFLWVTKKQPVLSHFMVLILLHPHECITELSS